MAPEHILSAFGIDPGLATVNSFGTGLINHTWKVNYSGKAYILQRINTNVFKNPQAIADNLERIGSFLKVHHPEYLFVFPEPTLSGEGMLQDKEGYYRLMPFIKNSVTYAVAPTSGIAREAARQFGLFTRNLCGFDAEQLQVTLPDFHDLSLRYQQFIKSLETGNAQRIISAKKETDYLLAQEDLVRIYGGITQNPAFKKRVTHHDTKISNVLFDNEQQGLCVIDLDTTMSGYFISDVGDMMRTYLCPLSEEETAFDSIHVRDDFFHAIATGYLSEMNEQLSEPELDQFVYSGEFMIYMQAVRFLADYFNNDVYYGSNYPSHNLDRARNQIALLKCYQEKKDEYRDQVQLISRSKSADPDLCT